MKRWRVFLIGVIVLFSAISITLPVMADPIRVLGIDTTSAWDYSTLGAVTNITFTESSITGFASVDLDLYDVLVVSETFLNGSVTLAAQATLDALKARETDIGNWLYAGHGLVALSEPIGSGPYDWLPDAVQPYVGTAIHDDTVRIIDPLHPVMDGLTSAGLSGWGTSSHGFITDGGLDIIVDDGVSRAITLAGTYGSGKIVLTLQDPDYHNFYGNVKPDQITFMQNAIEWAAEPVPEPATMFLLGSGLIGLAGVRRKKLKK